MRPSLTFWLLLLGILVAGYLLVMPQISGGSGARVTAAYYDIKGAIKTALDNFKEHNGYYPKNLQDLVQRPNDATNWSGPYLDELTNDPWGEPYVYVYPGRHNVDSYDLYSIGADGRDGTEDDIGNWQTTK